MSRNVTTAVAGHEVLEDVIGSDALATLNTTDKSSLVAAINELRANLVALDPDAFDGIDDDEVNVAAGLTIFANGTLRAALTAAEAVLAANQAFVADLGDDTAAKGASLIATETGTPLPPDVQAALMFVFGLASNSLDSATTNPGIADGATAGKIQTANACDFKIGGELFTKAATNDLWDLTGETNTGAGVYRAYSLELDDLGAASFQASSDQASEADAYAALPPIVESRIGVYIAGPTTNFGAALGAQGSYFNGNPVSV